MWIDDDGRRLYAACSSSTARKEWSPSTSDFNISGLLVGGDYISVLNIDEPGTDGLFGLHQLKTSGYAGPLGLGALSLAGFDAELIDESTLKFWLANLSPATDGNEFSDPYKVGANATIEAFILKRGEDTLVHVETTSHAAVFLPNKPAAVGNGAFLVTNDHSRKRESSFLACKG